MKVDPTTRRRPVDVVQAGVLVQLAAIALRADCPAKRTLAAGGIDTTVGFS
nr:hypothetical protein [uncultured Rhodopila sp.]